MREIEEIKRDILKYAKEIQPETWERMQKCLDEIFLAYALKARANNIESILEDIGHYERQHQHIPNVSVVCQALKYVVDSDTTAAVKYKLSRLWESEKKKEDESVSC